MPFIIALLQEGAETVPVEQRGGSIVNLIPLFGMLFLIFYFLMFRPQQKKEKKRVEMLSRLHKNDRVLTSGGIYGTILNIKDDEVMLRIDEANNVRVRFARSAVVGIVEPKEKEAGAEE